MVALGAVTAAAAGWRTDTNPAKHFHIATPAAWVWIPQNRTAAEQLAFKLEAQGKNGQAALVASYATDKWQNVPTRVFDGVEFPSRPSPIATDVVVERRSPPSGLPQNPSGLKELAAEFYSGLKSQSGLHLSKPFAVHLKGGDSMLLAGDSPAAGFGGHRTGFAVYLLFGHGYLWELEFRTDSTYFRGDTAMFRRIADTFRIV